MNRLNSFIFTCLIDFSNAKALKVARIPRMSEFNSKFGGRRDNCDAKESIAFCTRYSNNMPSLIRFVYEVGSEAFIALASGTQGTTTRSFGQFSLNLGVVATVFCARRYSTRGWCGNQPQVLFPRRWLLPGYQ